MSHPFSDRPIPNQAPRRSTIDIEEQRAWVGFYKRVGRDAALAAEVMAQLDSDAEMKRRHLALYLSCKQSLRVHKARQARDKRIGQGLHLLVQWTLVRPVAFVGGVAQNAYHRTADALDKAIAATPPASPAASKRGARPASGRDADSRVEPATAQVRSLLGNAEFADAHARFQHKAGFSPMFPVSPVSGSEDGSERAPEPREDRSAPAVQVSRRWCESAQGHGTCFDPCTDPCLARVLKTWRRDSRKVRPVLGDTGTGAGWLDEFDVVGTVGHSTGPLKVPLRVEPGETGGTAILCAQVLALMDWLNQQVNGLPLYRHQHWQPPELHFRASDHDAHPWAVVLHEQPVASLDDIGETGASLAFMRGESVEPRVLRWAAQSAAPDHSDREPQSHPKPSPSTP